MDSPDEVYKIYLRKFCSEADRMKRISLGRARFVLGFYFRVPSHKVTSVLADMQQHGLIKINGQRYIHILISEERFEDYA